MSMIERLDPTNDEQYAAFYAAYRAGHDDEWDLPNGSGEMRVELLEDNPYVDHLGFLACEETGEPVGAGIVEMNLKDNLDFAYMEVLVDPRYRRRGHGAAIVEALFEVCRLAGRRDVIIEPYWDLAGSRSASVSFAEGQGFDLDLAYVHRVLLLPATLPEAPVRDGYTVHCWRGRCPDQWLDQYAVLLSHLLPNAPSGELKLEKEFYDAERVRGQERRFDEQGRITQVSVAVSPDGDVVGHTQLVFPDEDPTKVYQWDTLVLSGHRGHGLGLSLKVEAMKQSADLLDGRRAIHTENAVSNGPMIAVNEALGFQPVRHLGEFVRRI